MTPNILTEATPTRQLNTRDVENVASLY